jgi:hypothetical protein
MARTGSHRRAPRPVDLTGTLERLALLLGDRIGAGIARALVSPSGGGAAGGHTARPPAPRKRCSREGCARDAAAKGLCKSHYNLMLYHRRKAEQGRRGTRRRTPEA